MITQFVLLIKPLETFADSDALASLFPEGITTNLIEKGFQFKTLLAMNFTIQHDLY